MKRLLVVLMAFIIVSLSSFAMASGNDAVVALAERISGTEEEFVKRVILRHKPWSSESNHLSMLEHGTVYLKRKINPADTYYSLFEMFYEMNPYSKISCDLDYYFVTTNLRVLVENNLLDDLKYICPPTDNHPSRVTVSFTTNIGVTREFNHHRVDSIAEESTRYCNYSKRNDGQLKIGLPAWLLNEESMPYIESHQFDTLISYIEDIYRHTDKELLEDWSAIDFYLAALTFAQWSYNMLIHKGWKPQQAREVLPLATKSQLIHTAFVQDWQHFFNLRAIGVSGQPHPNARVLAEPLMKEFIKRGYILEL